MKRLFLIIIAAGLSAAAFPQPEARRQAQRKAADASRNITTRARISYPVAAQMAEDVVWRRDIYREISLEDDANAGLYHPAEPSGGEMNLFTRIFKLMMRGEVKAYEYRLDGAEAFTDSARVKPRSFLDNYHIYYEKQADGRVRLDNSDIPSREVKSYYLKESAYYDQASATFHTKVIALCPVMTREDDFGGAPSKYPLFWVRYDDLAPYLGEQTVMASSLNNAATMSAADWFAKNMYRGKIYKTNNALGRTLSQYCPTDSAMAKEQRRIEGELARFEKSLWGDHSKRDSLDSASKAQGKAKAKKARLNRRAKAAKEGVSRRTKAASAQAGSQKARVTVRRQRH